MIDRKQIMDRAQTNVYGNLFPKEVIEKYDAPNRYYHTSEHLFFMVDRVLSNIPDNPSAILAAIYHDIVYDPYSSTNEEDSVAMMKDMLIRYPNSLASKCNVLEDATKIILETKDLNNNSEFNIIDRSILYYGTTSELIDYGIKIWKEFNRYSWTDFKAGHKKVILQILKDRGKLRPEINGYFSWLDSHKPTLAVYAGSFNPFHIGHKYVADQASKMFDKVILAIEHNPDKPQRNENEVVKTFHGLYQVQHFSDLLSNYIKHLAQDYSVSVVKGIRNAEDLNYEKVQERYLRELYPDINICYILTDPTLEHISSSGIKNLMMFDALVDQYLWK